MNIYDKSLYFWEQFCWLVQKLPVLKTAKNWSRNTQSNLSSKQHRIFTLMANWQFLKPWNTQCSKLYQTLPKTVYTHRFCEYISHSFSKRHTQSSTALCDQASLMAYSVSEHISYKQCAIQCVPLWLKQSMLSADCNSRHKVRSLTYTACSWGRDDNLTIISQIGRRASTKVHRSSL